MRMLAVLTGKILHEQRAVLVFCFLLLAVFFTFAVFLYATFGDTSMDALDRIPPDLLSGLFGGLFGGLSPLDTWMMTLFAHPLVFVLLAVIVISVTSRTLAGEVDRGTVDLLLSYPVARWQPVVACFFVVVAALVLSCAILWLSLHLGLRLGDIERPGSLPALRWVVVNLFALFFSLGGVALFFSASASEHGRAVGRSLGFVVVSFLLNLLASLWSRIEPLSALSVFHYYQPQPIVEGGSPSLGDLGLLAALGVLGFGAAVVVFSRRDIATV